MQQLTTAFPAKLDPDTVLQMHRLVAQAKSPPGLISDALTAERIDVLDILFDAGEFAHDTVAAASYSQVFNARSLRVLDWLISKGLKPGQSKDAQGPMWLGLDPATKESKGGLWQEAFLRLLEAGVFGVDDRVGRDFAQPYSLLRFALSNKGDALACEMLVAGARADIEDLQVALKSACAGAVGLIAPQIESMTLGDLWGMRHALDDRQGIPGLKASTEVDDRKIEVMTAAVNALAARALDASQGSRRSGVWGVDFVSALQAFEDPKQIREVVRRHPNERDELLRCACRADSVCVAQVLLEEGARLDATDGGRLPVVVPGSMLERDYSPHALHNAKSAPIMRLLLAFGADLQVEWQGKKVLHWAIDNFKGKVDSSTVLAGKGVFDFLAEQGADFAEGANGRSVKQLGATLCDDLKRHLMAIRTGERIASAMAESVDRVDIPGDRLEPGLL